MPIKINVAKAAMYAQVEPDFIAAMKEIWKKCWSKLNDEIKAQPPSYRKMLGERNAPVMSRLKALCTDPTSLDREITRLRGLPYERFFTRQYQGNLWLVGLTRPVEMTDDVRRYQGPRYFVYFPSNMVERGTDAPFHFVPEGNELVTARHPHHCVQSIYYDDFGSKQMRDYSDVRDPLDYTPSTCWGSFGTIATACIKSGDVVDLYRNIGIYLTRINQRSLLIHPFSSVFFLEVIGPASAPKEPAITKRTTFISSTNGRARR